MLGIKSVDRLIVALAILGVYISLCHGKTEYKLLEGKKSWHDADRDCRTRDGTLLVVDSDTHLKQLRHGKTEYKLLDGKKSWHDADRDCRIRDGTLLIVDSETHLKQFHKQLDRIGHGKTEYKLLEGKKSWHDADRDCRTRDGTLLVVDSENHLKQFRKQIDLETKLTVWTAAFRQQSPWVWIEGCFSAKALLKLSGMQISTNQASECAAMCEKTTYAALKGSTCYCLRDIRELSPLDARVCDIPCPGSNLETCGGQGAVSLYSLGGVNGYKESLDEVSDENEQTIHEESRSDWKNCVYILKHGNAVWVTTDCRKTLPFLCKIYKEDGIITEYKSPKNKIASWTDAREICHEEGGTLADLHANNMEAVSALPDHSEFWVGLFRNTTWTWHMKNDEETPMWCTSLTKDEVGEHHLQTESCSIPHPFVCQIESPVQLAQASSMVVYVVCGTIAWVLAIVTGVLIFFYMRKRNCRWRNRSGDTTEIHTSYFDMEEERTVIRPTPHHSYVNTPADSEPSGAGASAYETPRPNPKSAKGSDKPQQSACANVYASVKMTGQKREAGEQSDDVKGHVTKDATFGISSPRSSTSTEGDYDLVWDSVKFTKGSLRSSSSDKRNSQLSENIYTEIDKVFRVDVPMGADYIHQPTSLFPPSDDFGRQAFENKA